MKPLRECPQGRHHDCARTGETHLSGNICFVTHLETKTRILGRQGVDERAVTRKLRHRRTQKPEAIFTLTRTPNLAGFAHRLKRKTIGRARREDEAFGGTDRD